MSKDLQNIKTMYDNLKTEWRKKKPDWEDVAAYVGISVDMNYFDNKGHTNKGRDVDEYIDDPTAALSVNQAGDYLMGIMWGTGEDAFEIVPSRYVTDLVDEAVVSDWYEFATDQALYHINHPNAGFSTALQPYVYDQFSFGTSGIGIFKNKAFENAIEDNALIFRNYGVDNTMINEGKSGQPEIVAAVYNWQCNRIVGEFCKSEGSIDKEKLKKLPKEIQDAWKTKDINKEFQIVNMIFPREDFDPKLKGKRGTRYRGVWFMDNNNDAGIFFEEDFLERPISMARAVKVRGETYGRASGTMLISTIKSVNFMVSTAIEVVEKLSRPSLGVLNNAIFGDSVLDTSPDGLTVFNTNAAGKGGNPTFPIYDVGDPSAILEFLVPYLNEKITTAFKIDALLDFNSAKDMTATESLQRYAIRGKSLAGFLLQQKNEQLVPNSKRAISLLLAMGELGAHPLDAPDLAKKLRENKRNERIIPEEVIEVIESGRPWYELRFNNELEKLTRTQAIESMIQLINSITGIAALNPDIIEAVNWYKLLKDINDNLDYNSQLLISEDEFKEKMAAGAAQAAQMQQAQMGLAGAGAQKDLAQADKAKSEARNVTG